ncbi:hypothetical protein A0J61_10496 [Choanephora cucurbitarum]|uniref:Uncharacterized protein n=1 Tax=Choanephora cucurbitarum TaxID=101091 RepID=A0A1C7MYI2_9FUNG|nr:hypothetical protein A0J61_10496 [Choanephora cucurbitarum]
MVLASLYIVSLRWKPPKLMFMEPQQKIMARLALHIPEALIQAQMDQLDQLVRHQCPSHHIDLYVFIVAVVCVVCSAVFTFVARSLEISMWCPLLLLLIPTGLSFWTSKRRSTLATRTKKFEGLVRKTLYDFTTVNPPILWSLEPVALDHVPFPSAKLCLMIQLTELDDQLPSYQEAIMTQYIQMPEPVAMPF